jgi:hypothetical protein
VFVVVALRDVVVDCEAGFDDEHPDAINAAKTREQDNMAQDLDGRLGIAAPPINLSTHVFSVCVDRSSALAPPPTRAGSHFAATGRETVE